MAPGPDGASRVPVVHLYGRLEGGGAFLMRDDRQRPHFYVRASDAPRAAAGRPLALAPIDRRTFDGAPVCRVEVEVPSDVPPLRDELHAAGVETFEADVRFASRYLIERGIKGGCEIDGTPVAGGGALEAVFHNPVLRPAEVTIEPRVLSFDIETDAKSERLLAISLFSPDVDEVLIVDGSGRPMPERATCCADERAALEAFAARVAALDPDVLTGWNIVDFDLSVLDKIAARLKVPLHLGREPGAVRIRKAEGYFGSGQAVLPGRLVLDGIDLLRGAFVRMDDYSLDAVARDVLGEGKAVAGDARDRIAEIIHNYKHDLAAFALYARTDARLAYQIVSKLRLIELAFARSQLTGMTPDRVAASIASFDFLYLSELERIHIVAPSVRGSDSRVHAAQQGGHVLEPVAGLHRNVWVFDFKSLYPSIIRTFNIDPLSYVPAAAPEADLIRTPEGAFRRAPAILPRLLDELFPRREAAKKRGDETAAHAIKILMNSFYGVLGTSACRFYNPALANSITGMGKQLLLWSKSWFEAAGYTVLYGDTDSLFVRAAGDDPGRASATALELAATLNTELSRHIAEEWRSAEPARARIRETVPAPSSCRMPATACAAPASATRALIYGRGYARRGYARRGYARRAYARRGCARRAYARRGCARRGCAQRDALRMRPACIRPAWMRPACIRPACIRPAWMRPAWMRPQSSSWAWRSCAGTGLSSRSAFSANSMSACSSDPAGRGLPRRYRRASAQRPARRGARLSQEPAQGYRGVHGDHAAARGRRPQIEPASRPLDSLRRHHGGCRAARQSQASARPRALCRVADQAGGRAGAGDARPALRARDRRRAPVRSQRPEERRGWSLVRNHADQVRREPVSGGWFHQSLVREVLGAVRTSCEREPAVPGARLHSHAAPRPCAPPDMQNRLVRRKLEQRAGRGLLLHDLAWTTCSTSSSGPRLIRYSIGPVPAGEVCSR